MYSIQVRDSSFLKSFTVLKRHRTPEDASNASSALPTLRIPKGSCVATESTMVPFDTPKRMFEGSSDDDIWQAPRGPVKGTLTIKIHQAKYLTTTAYLKNQPDPYVKVRVDGNTVHKTNVHYDSANPSWESDNKVDIELNDALSQSVSLDIKDRNVFRIKNIVIGHLDLNVVEHHDVSRKWFPLTDTIEAHTRIPAVMLSVKFLPCRIGHLAQVTSEESDQAQTTSQLPLSSTSVENSARDRVIRW